MTPQVKCSSRRHEDLSKSGAREHEVKGRGQAWHPIPEAQELKAQWASQKWRWRALLKKAPTCLWSSHTDAMWINTMHIKCFSFSSFGLVCCEMSFSPAGNGTLFMQICVPSKVLIFSVPFPVKPQWPFFTWCSAHASLYSRPLLGACFINTCAALNENWPHRRLPVFEHWVPI